MTSVVSEVWLVIRPYSVLDLFLKFNVFQKKPPVKGGFFLSVIFVC